MRRELVLMRYAIVYLYSDMTASLCNEMKGVLDHFVAH